MAIQIGKWFLLIPIVLIFCASCVAPSVNRQDIPLDLLQDTDKLIRDPRYGTKAIWEFHDSDGNTTTGTWHYLDPWALGQFFSREYLDFVEQNKKSGHLYVWWDLDRHVLFILRSYEYGKVHGFEAAYYPNGMPMFTGFYIRDIQHNFIRFDNKGKVVEESFGHQGQKTENSHSPGAEEQDQSR